MRKPLLVVTLLIAQGSLVFAQGGHMGTPQEQKSLLERRFPLLSKATG